MRRKKSHFGHPLRLRSGIFVFLLLLMLLVHLRFALPEYLREPPLPQMILDSLMQGFTDSLKLAEPWQPSTRRIDPNRLDDFRGYLLGLQAAQLDRLYAFRARGGTLYDMATLQQVAGLTDAEASRLEPQLYFPGKKRAPPKVQAGCLNTVSEATLMEVRGIGPVLSRRIIKYRNYLGGFLHPSQLYDVYGLAPDVARRAMERFRVCHPPEIERVHLNSATAEVLARIPYFSREVAAKIVRYREANGPFLNLSQLDSVPGVPSDKIGRIGLYLDL